MPETKKPTCVGFFVGCDLLTSSQVQQQERLEQQRQQQERLEQQRQQQEPWRRQQQVLEQQVLQQQVLEQQEFQQAFRHKQQETGPTERQQEQSVSFFFLHIRDVKIYQETESANL